MKHIQEYKSFINESVNNAFDKITNIQLVQLAEMWFGKINFYKFTEKLSLYRGFGDNAKKIGENGYFKEYKKPRISPNATNNFYNIYLSNAKEWSKFPKRNMSLICTTSKDKARGYKPIYKMVPKQGAKIAMCPESDIWFSFDTDLSLYKLTELIDFICEINKIDIKIFESWPKTQEFIEFVSNKYSIQQFQDVVSNSGIEITSRDILEFMEVDTKIGKIKFDAFLRNYFTTDGFELFDFDAKSPKFKLNREFWFADEAIFYLD